MSKALKAAIEANDATAAKQALKTVKDLSRKLPKADPPLLYACKLGADAAVEVLIEAGAALRGESQYEGEHPFAIAAKNGHAKVVTLLARHGAPQKVVDHSLFITVLDGKEESVRAILQGCHPAIPERVLEVSTWWQDGRIFRLLLAHGADVNVPNDGKANWEQRGRTPLHDAAGSGHLEPLRLLLDHGANADATDAWGRTPLMCLAARMPQLDQDLRVRQQAARRVLTEAHKALMAKIESQSTRRGDRSPTDGMACVRLLLERSADATRKDRFGNDALMYYEWERRRDRAELNGELVALLEQAGATGGGVTADLLWAIWADDVATARRALQAGADPNHDTPPPVSNTPLLMARSKAMVELLLAKGANPNKPSQNSTPLISAARSGELEIVKLLIQAGADIRAVEPRSPGSEYVANAYSAAEMKRKTEVAEYLKSLGAGKPVLANWKPLEPGVGIWENFSEVIVRGEAGPVASAVAQLIRGRVEENAYGKDLMPGKRTYLVVRPKGMAWCNLFQIAPPPGFFDTDTGFLRQLATTAQSAVILAQYSDAAGATSIERFEPDGTSQKDEDCDRDTLEEIVGELGDEAPAGMKKRLAEMEESEEEEPDSERRLLALAKKEEFTIAWGGLQAEPGKKVDVSFTNLPAQAFDGVAWVSD